MLLLFAAALSSLSAGLSCGAETLNPCRTSTLRGTLPRRLFPSLVPLRKLRLNLAHTSSLAAVLGVVLLFARIVAAEPSVEDVKAAGEQFNLGRAAFKEEEFAQAAEHFERADGLAPNAKVLELAIDARVEAGQLDRAATLAVLAKTRHEGDERFNDLDALLAKAEKQFGKVEISCDRPCSLVVGTRLVHGEAADQWVLFLPEGAHSIRAGWGEKQTATKEFEANPGESGSLNFVAPLEEDVEPVPPPPTEGESDEFDEVLDPFGMEGDKPAPPADEPQADKSSAGLSPTWFWIGAGTTVALAGVSTWSAIDTQSSPGTAAVREECGGTQNTSCSAYATGQEKEARTNLLWGVTGGALAVTTVLFFITDFGGGSDAKEGDYSDSVAVSPWLDPHGTALGATAGGRF